MVTLPPPFKHIRTRTCTHAHTHTRTHTRTHTHTHVQVELKTCAQTSAPGALQKSADFVRAYMLGFAVEDAVALLRLDDLYLDSFDITDGM